MQFNFVTCQGRNEQLIQLPIAVLSQKFATCMAPQPAARESVSLANPAQQCLADVVASIGWLHATKNAGLQRLVSQQSCTAKKIYMISTFDWADMQQLP